MKNSIIALIFLCVAPLSACQPKQWDEGKLIGEKISSAVEAHNRAALEQATASYDSISTSVKEDKSAIGALREGMLSAITGTQGDTAALAIKSLAMTPTLAGENFAVWATDSLIAGKITGKKLYGSIATMEWIYAFRGMGASAKAFKEAFQGYIDALPIDRQMLIYSKSATPAQLGAAMHIEASRGMSSLQTAKSQIDALKSIYTPEDFATFMRYYNLKQ
jgi:hypothetical protein